MIGDHYIGMVENKNNKSKKNYFLPLFNVVGHQTKVKSYLYTVYIIFFLNLTYIYIIFFLILLIYRYI